MPTLLHERGFRIHFYADEGAPREPPHVHVQKGREGAKFWLTPDVRLEGSNHVSAADLKKLERVVADQVEFLRRWNEFFPT